MLFRSGFSRQEYWSGLPFPSLGDLPDPGIEPRSPALQPDALRTLEWVAISSSRHLPNLGVKPRSLMSPALAGGFFTTIATWEAQIQYDSCPNKKRKRRYGLRGMQRNKEEAIGSQRQRLECCCSVTNQGAPKIARSHQKLGRDQEG